MSYPPEVDCIFCNSKTGRCGRGVSDPQFLNELPICVELSGQECFIRLSSNYCGPILVPEAQISVLYTPPNDS